MDETKRMQYNLFLQEGIMIDEDGILLDESVHSKVIILSRKGLTERHKKRTKGDNTSDDDGKSQSLLKRKGKLFE